MRCWMVWIARCEGGKRGSERQQSVIEEFPHGVTREEMRREKNWQSLRVMRCWMVWIARCEGGRKKEREEVKSDRSYEKRREMRKRGLLNEGG